MGSNTTFVVRKDNVEVVVKMGKDTYAVVGISASGDNKVSIFCSWNSYFRRLYSAKDPAGILAVLAKDCPKLLDLATKEGEFAFINYPSGNGEMETGIGKEIDVKFGKNFVTSVVNDEILLQAFNLINFNLAIYHEILEHCPIEEWRKGLAEVRG